MANRFSGVPEKEWPVRSLMMRLYRAYRNGEDFYPAQFVNGEAPDLEAKGWIERHGQGWRITEAGIQAWAEMIGEKLLRYHLGRRHGQYEDAIDLLKRLEKMNETTTRTCTYPGCDQPRMVSKTGTEQRMCEIHQRQYWKLHQRKRRKPDAVKINAPKVSVEAHNCNGCVYREIVDLQRQRNPKIDDLVKAMEAQQRLLEELGL